MKKNFWKLTVLAVAAAAGLSAQDRTVMHVRVPFDFSVRGVALAAGQYNVLQNVGSGTLTIHSQAAGKSVFLSAGAVIPVSPAPDTKLVFLRFGDTYVLAEVWTQDGSKSISPTKHERDLARNAKPREVAVAAVPVGRRD